MKRIFSMLCVAAAAFAPLLAHADVPGAHPAYIHALSDLRTARWLISHRPGNAQVSADENVAIARVDDAINEIKRAAIDDGKDMNDHPPVDVNIEHKGRLHKAEAVLRKVRFDIARQEDDPMVRGLRDRALRDVDGALSATHRAIVDLERSE